MRVRIAVLAAAACGLFALSGCQLLDKGDDKAAAPTPTPTAASKTPSPGSNGKASASANSRSTGKATGGATRGGDLPNVCTLLTKAEVSALAGGKTVSQVDEDGQPANSPTRYCQWQLSGGQIAIFLTKTTSSDFKTEHSQQTRVTGVGDEAHQADGHLYVLHGDIQIDSYVRNGGSDASNLQVAKNTALKIITKL